MAFLLETLLGMIVVISPMFSWPVEFDHRDIINWTEVEWMQYMRHHTAKDSHDRLQRGLFGKTFEGHTPGHEFGHALYEIFEERGMPICDSSYYGGCLHEYNARMILDQGADKVLDAVETCREVWGERDPSNLQNCHHGIGHAFLMMFGYNETGLKQALEYCRKEVYANVADGQSKECYDGAFMDFNQQNITHQSLFTHRDFDPTNPYYPCDVVEAEYRSSCYYRLTRLWVVAHDAGSRAEQYAVLGNWCRNMPDQQLLDICRLGVNSSIVTYGGAQNMDEATEACRAAYTEPDGYDSCLIKVEDSLQKEFKLED